MFVICTSDWLVWTPSCRAEHQIRGYQNSLHIFHNSHNKYSSFRWRQTSRLQCPPYKLCFTVLSTQCLCGPCQNNHLSIISKKLALWQTNYSSGFHPLAQEEADYTFIFVTSVGHQVPTKATLSLPSTAGQGQKIELKAHGLREGEGEITHPLPSWTKRTQLTEKLIH